MVIGIVLVMSTGCTVSGPEPLPDRSNRPERPLSAAVAYLDSVGWHAATDNADNATVDFRSGLTPQVWTYSAARLIVRDDSADGLPIIVFDPAAPADEQELCRRCTAVPLGGPGTKGFVKLENQSRLTWVSDDLTDQESLPVPPAPDGSPPDAEVSVVAATADWVLITYQMPTGGPYSLVFVPKSGSAVVYAKPDQFHNTGVSTSIVNPDGLRAVLLTGSLQEPCISSEAVINFDSRATPQEIVYIATPLGASRSPRVEDLSVSADDGTFSAVWRAGGQDGSKVTPCPGQALVPPQEYRFESLRIGWVLTGSGASCGSRTAGDGYRLLCRPAGELSDIYAWDGVEERLIAEGISRVIFSPYSSER